MKRILVFLCLFNLFFLTVSAEIKKIYNGDRNLNHIYLTFDDGYSAENTEEILDILKANNVKAFFFIEGGFLSQNPILVKRIAEEQTLVNHTFSHKDITKMSDKEFIEDIKKFEDECKRITGKMNDKKFRPPMGKINDSKMKVLEKLGYKVYLWDVSYYDYNPYNDKGVDYALDNILKQTKNGSIILMHTLTKSNVKVLPKAIKELREKGFIFSDINEII